MPVDGPDKAWKLVEVGNVFLSMVVMMMLGILVWWDI